MLIYPQQVKAKQSTGLSKLHLYLQNSVGFLDADNQNIEDFHTLTSNHLRVDNVEAIEDIFVSEEWTTFMKKLIDDPNSAPRACQFYCGQKWKTKDVTVI